MSRAKWIFLSLFVVTVSLLFLLQRALAPSFDKDSEIPTIRVLTYSTIVKEWGAGPEIAKEFLEQENIRVEWLPVQNAGMLLENLSKRDETSLPDVVFGLDILSLGRAEENNEWLDLTKESLIQDSSLPMLFAKNKFVAYDWSPLSFLFKRDQFVPPKRIDDLLAKEYSNTLALQDPRRSSTGLYFLIWVLSLKGEEDGFRFLEKLKPSVRVLSPTWSSSYSLFKNNQVPTVFSFFTSVIYHHLNENDRTYQPVYFDHPHIYSMEYAAIPKQCRNCNEAKSFVRFLQSPKAQKILMNKNYMLPALDEVKRGSAFDFPQQVSLIPPKSFEELMKKKDKLLERWESIGL